MTTPKTRSTLLNLVFILVTKELDDLTADLSECTCPEVVQRSLQALHELHAELVAMEGAEELANRVERLLVRYDQ